MTSWCNACHCCDCRDSDDMGMAQDLFQSQCWAAPSPRQSREYMDLETNKGMYRCVQCKSAYIAQLPFQQFCVLWMLAGSSLVSWAARASRTCALPFLDPASRSSPSHIAMTMCGKPHAQLPAMVWPTPTAEQSWAAVFRQHPKEQCHRYVAHLTLHSMSVPGGPLLERLTRLSPCAPSHAKPWNCPQAYPLGEAISKPWQQRAKWCSPLLSTGSAVAWAPSLLAFECHDPCWWATMHQHPLAAPSKLGSTSKWRWAKSQHHPPRLAVACRSSHIASMPWGVKHNIHVHLGTSESSCLGTSGTSGLNVLCSRSWPRPCKGSWWPCHPQQWGAAISAKEHFWPGCVARLLNDLDGYPDWWPRHKGHAVLGTAGFYLLQLFQLLAWLKSSESSWLSCSSSSLTKTFASSPSWPCSADFCSLLTYFALEFLGFDAKAANSRTQQETWNESRTLMVSP